MVGKYIDLADSYKSLNEALVHAGIHHRVKVKIEYIDSEALNESNLRQLEGVDAILVPGGFGSRGIDGKMLAVKYARENDVPYLGICLGMQLAVIEFARHCAGMPGAHSTEFDADTPYPVVALVNEWLDASGQKQTRNAESDLGGTMRLGGQTCQLLSGSLVATLYDKGIVVERHRHRYEVNGELVSKLEQFGLVVSGRSEDGSLVEVVELGGHPWFVACQFHPEFTSNPRDGHPLFRGFIDAAMAYADKINATT